MNLKKLTLGLALMVVATTVTTLTWNSFHKPSVHAPVSPYSKEARQVSTTSSKQFDLSNLPRALELPLVRTPLQPGDIAPDFNSPISMDKCIGSPSYADKLSFFLYPRDLTFSCVGEAISFDQTLPAFRLRGAKLFSVSVQNVQSKAEFAGRYGISYPLLADSDKTTAQNYRVLSKDGVAGRVTFIIGPDGRIQWTSQKVNVETHAQDVLNVLDKRPVRLSLPTNGVVPARANNATNRGFKARQSTGQLYAMNAMSRGF